MKIILSNWTSGGTGLTNFLKDELPLYERAIDRHGDPDYIICSKALGTEYFTSDMLSDNYHSLHFLKAGQEDSGSFWRTFETIQKQPLLIP